MQRKHTYWIFPVFLGCAAQASAYQKTITLNAGAAGITADAAGYPLSVQLNAQNFDFSQAKDDGADLRFADESGKPLPFEIESWDKAGRAAAVWVKTDVKGGGSTKILMQWGNAALTSASDGKAVFDAAGGYLGAWHLNQDAAETSGGFKDASWNEAHGTGVLVQAGSPMAARSGKGVNLVNPNGNTAGKIQWIEVAGEKVLKEFGADEHPIAVSIWTYANDWGGYYQTMFSRGDGEYSLQEDYQNKTEVCMSPATPPHHECALTSGPVTKQWTHYMIVRANPPYSTNKLDLYINGKKAAGTTGAGAHKVFPFGMGNNSQNGRTRSQRGFNGILDECRVYKIEKNEAWAKLEFESQKEGSKLLTFGETSAGITEPWLKRRAEGSRFPGLYDAGGRLLDGAARRAQGAAFRAGHPETLLPQ